MGDQVVEEVGTADGVDVVVGSRTQLVLDLAPDVVALLLDRTGCRAGVVEVEVGLGIGCDTELGEQVDVQEDALEVRIRTEGLRSLVAELQQCDEQMATAV
ncbi:MAG: hypothetical protein OET79_16570 [Nitrospirota bacterium]|nr:hypothetical protein [Nitrospirota bacterium]